MSYWARIVERVVAGEAGVVQDDFDVRVDALDGFLGGFALGASDVVGAVHDLALQIGKIHGVKIDHANFADAGRGQVHGNG